MRMQPPEDHDDSALFRAAIGEVTPLRKVETPAIEQPRPKPRARMAEQDEAQALGEFARLLHSSTPLEAGDVASYRRDTLPPQSIPSTIFIDAQGRVAARILGRVDETRLTGILDTLVKESQ